MEKMNDLKALLAHEVRDLMSVEDQIIEAMPGMIEKAQNSDLKKALEQHLSVTEKQRTRLDEVQKIVSGEAKEENKGFLSDLFGAITGGEKCKGMEGIISEGEKIMGADMDVDVKDAAVIACAQKIEHYEICGYGTARAYAMQLGLTEAEKLLRQTLDEEYVADDLLTKLAYSGINEDAESTDEAGGSSRKKAGGGRADNTVKKAAAKKKVEPKKAATGNIKKAASKASNGKAVSKQAAAKVAPAKKAASKK